MNAENRRDVAEKAFVQGVLYASDTYPEPSPATFERFREWWDEEYDSDREPPSEMEYVGHGPGAFKEVNPSAESLFGDVDCEGERNE